MIIQEVRPIEVKPIMEPFKIINKLYRELDDYFKLPEAVLGVDAGRNTAREVECLLELKD